MNTEPVAITVAVAAVLSTGVTLAAFVFAIDPAAQVAIVAFGNALIALGATIFLRPKVTPTP